MSNDNTNNEYNMIMNINEITDKDNKKINWIKWQINIIPNKRKTEDFENTFKKKIEKKLNNYKTSKKII